jgi:hypothetical protein
MANTYTTGLKLVKPGLNDAGWGTTVNDRLTDLVDQAVVGSVDVAVTSGGTTTLPAIADGASSDARNMTLVITGSLTSVQTATVRVPATVSGIAKLYSVTNSAGGTVTVETSGGASVAVPNGKSMLLRVTSAGVYEAVNYSVSFSLGTLSLTNALAATSGGTGQSSYAVGDLLYANTTTTLAKLADVATGNVLRSGGVGVAPAWGKADLTTDVTGTLPVASGGTGAATLAANNVLLGNGTSAVQTVAPGTAGNLLTSVGGTWASAPPPAGGVTSLNSQTGAVVTTGLGDIGSVAVLMIATNTNVAVGSTVAGSDLRYGWTPNFGAMTYPNFTDFAANRGNISATYNGGGTSLTGTWRKVSSGNTYFASGGSYAGVNLVSGCCGSFQVVQVFSAAYVWAAALYVRVS